MFLHFVEAIFSVTAGATGKTPEIFSVVLRAVNETWNMYNGAANIEVSAGVAPCNMVDFGIFLNFCCETSFRKSRTAFYFCNGRNDRSGDKSKFHCATPVRETTGFARFCHARCVSQSETRTTASRDQFQPFMLHRSRLLKLVSQRRCTSVSDKHFNV